MNDNRKDLSIAARSREYRSGIRQSTGKVLFVVSKTPTRPDMDNSYRYDTGHSFVGLSTSFGTVVDSTLRVRTGLSNWRSKTKLMNT